MEQVENKRDDLGRLLPGNTANPNGRPKSPWTWRSLLIEAAEEEQVDEETGETIPIKKVMARKLVSKGKEGDVQALKEFGDRIDGKAPQALELTGKNGNPVEQSITVQFV